MGSKVHFWCCKPPPMYKTAYGPALATLLKVPAIQNNVNPMYTNSLVNAQHKEDVSSPKQCHEDRLGIDSYLVPA